MRRSAGTSPAAAAAAATAPVLELSSSYFLLNPDGDLPATQESFQSWLEGELGLQVCVPRAFWWTHHIHGLWCNPVMMRVAGSCALSRHLTLAAPCSNCLANLYEKTFSPLHQQHRHGLLGVTPLGSHALQGSIAEHAATLRRSYGLIPPSRLFTPTQRHPLGAT